MPNIEDYLKQIATATYGREVRSSIVNAIRKCYEDLPKRIREISIRDRTPSGNLWCDVNNDGIVDLNDAQMVQRYAVGIIDTMPDMEAADIYGTGVINTEVAQRIAHFINEMDEGDVIAQFEYTYFDGTVEKSCGILSLHNE